MSRTHAENSNGMNCVWLNTCVLRQNPIPAQTKKKGFTRSYVVEDDNENHIPIIISSTFLSTAEQSLDR